MNVIFDLQEEVKGGPLYDEVSANTASSVQKNSKFQSGHRVVKMVLNT